MKAIYLLSILGFTIPSSTLRAAPDASEAAPAATSPAPNPSDLTQFLEIPAGSYKTTLELKQLDGLPVTLRLEVRNRTITGNHERFGNLSGQISPIGNGVFMVRLRGNGYIASQFWIFRSDGSGAIKEIPDRGEKQTARLDL